MSYIFRSDTPAVGDRVVVRRIVPGTAHRDVGAAHSDIIGHITAIEPGVSLSIRPQLTGGYPSSHDSITLRENEIHIIKKLSPRTIRNSDIRKLELAHAQLFPSTHEQWTSQGHWLMRAGGPWPWSNTAAPLGPSAAFAEVPIAEITEFFATHHTPALLLIPERIGKIADQWIGLRSHDYLMLTASLESHPVVNVTLDHAWPTAPHFLPPHLATLPPAPNQICASITDNQTPLAAAIARVHEHYLGIAHLEVLPAYRRRGLATRLLQALSNWGIEHGATEAIVHISAENTTGVALLQASGFVEHHRFGYAQFHDSVE